jgi:hypothetical protein
VTFLDFDVTQRVLDGARTFVGDHLAAIDRAASRVDLRERATEWWQTLQSPIHLADSLWMVIQPEGITRGRVDGMGDSVSIPLALRAHPYVVAGPRPTVDLLELPALEIGEVSPHLDVLVEGQADYGSVSSLLQQALGGTEVDGMGRRVQLDSLRVFGVGGGRLALEVLISGDAQARLFLTGTPRLVSDEERVWVPDLDFDIHTRDVVIAAASWLGSERLRAFLQERATWPAAPAVAWLTERLRDGLNQDISEELRISGDVQSVEILGILARTDALFVTASARGTAALTVVHDPD